MRERELWLEKWRFFRLSIRYYLPLKYAVAGRLSGTITDEELVKSLPDPSAVQRWLGECSRLLQESGAVLGYSVLVPPAKH
jgi:hypothetical protein